MSFLFTSMLKKNEVKVGSSVTESHASNSRSCQRILVKLTYVKSQGTGITHNRESLENLISNLENLGHNVSTRTPLIPWG